MWEHILIYPQGKKGLKGQYFQDSKGFKGSMFQWYRRSKGFRVSRDRGSPLIDKGSRWDWRFQNPRVSEKYINMSSIKISSSVHSVPLCSLFILWFINGQWEVYLILETGPMGGRTPRDGIVLVLVLVLIKDAFTIKRMHTLRHPYTRASFLCQ